jgi:hypothetical protein
MGVARTFDAGAAFDLPPAPGVTPGAVFRISWASLFPDFIRLRALRRSCRLHTFQSKPSMSLGLGAGATHEMKRCRLSCVEKLGRFWLRFDKFAPMPVRRPTSERTSSGARTCDPCRAGRAAAQAAGPARARGRKARTMSDRPKLTQIVLVEPMDIRPGRPSGCVWRPIPVLFRQRWEGGPTCA